MRNHLTWARIRAHGDGHNIPREISVENGGITFKMQLWVELPAKAVVGEGERVSSFAQKFFEESLPVNEVQSDKYQAIGTSHCAHGNPCDLPSL